MALLPSISEIESGLFIGNSTSSYDVPTLRNNHITAIVSLDDAPYGQWTRGTNSQLVPKDRHLWIGCLDSPTQDLLQHMDSICNFIDRMSLSAESPLPSILPQQNPEDPGSRHVVGGVLVHCGKGVSRSATAVVAYLMRKHHTTLPDALAIVRQKRKVKPSPNFMDQLKVWEEVEYQIWEDTQEKVPKLPYAAYLQRRAETLRSLGLTGNEPICPFFSIPAVISTSHQLDPPP
jgi:hypothetical protein